MEWCLTNKYMLATCYHYHYDAARSKARRKCSLPLVKLIRKIAKVMLLDSKDTGEVDFTCNVLNYKQNYPMMYIRKTNVLISILWVSGIEL